MSAVRGNRLAGETSPYLLQHADNPVDWYPWGDEALSRARRDNKPILLSIGYSACHWCHVMAHESFEDVETAELMNRHFVNIKIDREERPDLDKIYQTAHQLLTQRGGGWPLTMFLEPQHLAPFFGGTYFPKESRFGLPSFRELLLRIADFYDSHNEDIARQTQVVREVFEQLNAAPGAASGLDAEPLQIARRRLEQSYDARFGGFGQAPKFPHPASLERLLRHWQASSGEDRRALEMALVTLQRMAEGGLYDQLGGGFCRYSVDSYWMIPHFEKMLYDNASLLAVYAGAAEITGEPLFARVAAETAAWVLREMRDPSGGFYSTLDADSEGHEGKFYVWDRDEIRSLLEARELALIEPLYGLDREPNFEGRWHLHVFERLDALAEAAGLSPADARQIAEEARRKLFERREQRVRPGRDEKILTSWNALMVRGLAAAARVLERPDLAEAAGAALGFMRRELYRSGRLLATWKDGRARFAAYLDDYAYTIEAVLALLELRWSSDELAFATELADVLIEHFEDSTAGGFFFTADDHEKLLHRPKHFGDDAIPSGNGVAARALLQLGHLLGEPRYLDAAERTLRAAWPALSRAPEAHVTLLDALEDWLEPAEIIIVRASVATDRAWRAAARPHYAPRRRVLVIPDDAGGLPESLAARRPLGDGAAYVCRGPQCSAGLSSPDALAEYLRSR